MMLKRLTQSEYMGGGVFMGFGRQHELIQIDGFVLANSKWVCVKEKRNSSQTKNIIHNNKAVKMCWLDGQICL